MLQSSHWNGLAFRVVATVLVVTAIVLIGNPYWSLLLLFNVFLTYVIQTRHELPDRVAIHFRPDLEAAGWISRRAFLVLSPAFVATMSLLLVAISFAMARAKIGFMARHVAWMASLLLGLFFAVHALTISANRRSPARLPRSFWGVMVAFLLGVAVWVVLIATHDRWGWPR